MSDDFPAAHSMDTTWFAIDRDGHVGVFDSGEPGAVPRVTAETIGQGDVLESELVELPVLGEPTWDRSAVLHPGFRPGVLPQRTRVTWMWPSEGEARILVFADDSEIGPAVRALPGVWIGRVGDWTILRLDGSAMGRDDPRAQTWATFVKAAYEGRTMIAGHAFYGHELELARRGVFSYVAHDARFNMPEPYGRKLVPSRPVRLDELPPKLRDQVLARPRLAVSFLEERYVQPAELLPVETWESGVYLASDGVTVRPLPGREDHWASETSVLEDDARFEPLVLAPPR